MASTERLNLVGLAAPLADIGKEALNNGYSLEELAEPLAKQLAEEAARQVGLPVNSNYSDALRQVAVESFRLAQALLQGAASPPSLGVAPEEQENLPPLPEEGLEGPELPEEELPPQAPPQGQVPLRRVLPGLR